MNTFLQRVGFIAQLLVSLVVLAGFFGTLAVLLFAQSSDILPAVRDVLLVLVGVLAGSFKDVVGYWVGSSHGSTIKTAAGLEKVGGEKGQ